jgi:hypothetical protein
LKKGDKAFLEILYYLFEGTEEKRTRQSGKQEARKLNRTDDD